MTSPTPLFARALRRGALVLFTLLLASACGGGVGTGGTGSFSFFSGPITGLGSIVVNGVRIDIDAADVTDEDQLSRGRGELRLGTVVSVETGAVDDSSTPPRAVATRVVINGSLVGTIETPPSAATTTTMTVAGQVVSLSAGTVVDDRFAGGLAALVQGVAVEVYGFFDARTGVFGATRIEPARAASPTSFRVRGTVANLAASSFTIGNATYLYTTAPAGLANGVEVRLTVQTTPDASGRWTVLAFDRRASEPTEADRAEAEGRITNYVSNADFTVNGVRVDASGVAGLGGLAAGVKVEVKGALRNGVLVATSVQVDDDGAGSGSGSGGGSGGGSTTSGTEFEFIGKIQTLDTANRRFTVAGHSESISYEQLGTTGLQVGTSVHVHGRLAADRVTYVATEIEIEP